MSWVFPEGSEYLDFDEPVYAFELDASGALLVFTASKVYRFETIQDLIEYQRLRRFKGVITDLMQKDRL